MYKIIGIKTNFQDIRFRTPLVIRGEEIEYITLADVSVKLKNDKDAAEGRAQVLLSDVWAMAGSRLSHPDRDYLMRSMLEAKCAILISDRHREFPKSPLEHHLTTYDEVLRVGSAFGLPQLAVNNSISAVDLALWEAFAKLNGKDIYACFSSNTLESDKGGITRFGEHFHKPNTSVRVLHTLGGADKLYREELTGNEPNDGIPNCLEDYIEQQGISAVKIKLKGDVDEDVSRIEDVVHLLQSKVEEGVIKDFVFTVDPNESYKGVDQLAIFLDRLRGKLFSDDFEKLLYIEQPTSRDLNAPNQDVHYLVKEFGKPIVIDEMAVDYTSVLKAIRLGWNGIAFKPTAKVFSETLLELAIAKENALYVCVQDLTNPGLALIHHLDFARRLVSEDNPVETNARQYLPRNVANSMMPNQSLTSLYAVKDGRIDVSVIR